MTFSGGMPDVTPVQFAAVVGWIVAQAVAYGVLDVRYQQLAVSIGATAVAVAWKWADAHIRGRRALAFGANPSLITDAGKRG